MNMLLNVLLMSLLIAFGGVPHRSTFSYIPATVACTSPFSMSQCTVVGPFVTIPQVGSCLFVDSL